MTVVLDMDVEFVIVFVHPAGLLELFLHFALGLAVLADLFHRLLGDGGDLGAAAAHGILGGAARRLARTRRAPSNGGA